MRWILLLFVSLQGCGALFLPDYAGCHVMTSKPIYTKMTCTIIKQQNGAPVVEQDIRPNENH